MKKEKKYEIAAVIMSVAVILMAIAVIGRPPRRPPKRAPRVSLAVKAKIAIVLDDFGYNLNNIPTLLKIKYPLTISVLPNLSYSQRIAAWLHKRGLGIILHLPLEPHEKYHWEENTITAALKESDISAILSGDLASVPFAQGVSNHMGSLATEDIRLMSIIFKELKKRGLYFLDSYVTPKSICQDLAQSLKIKFAKRDIFLDNKEEAAYIKEQLYKLKNRAKRYKEAIGIGHDRKVTLEVLKEMMPQLEQEGYRFVFVSDLARIQ